MSELNPVPANLDMEKALLGGIMHDPQNAYPLAADILTPESFYLRGNGQLFALMGKLHRKGQPPDFTAIHEALSTAGHLDRVGGLLALVDMQGSVYSGSQVESHAKRLAELAACRALIAILTECIKHCQSAEIPLTEITGGLFERVGQIETGTPQSGYEHVSVTTERLKADIERRMERIAEGKQAGKTRQQIEGDVVPGIQTGIFGLDGMIGGIKPGEVMTIAALTGAGKSAAASTFAYEMAKRGIPVGYVSLEMSDSELGARFVATASMRSFEGGLLGIGTRRFDYPEFNETETSIVRSALRQITDAPIYILDRGHLSLRQLRAETAKAVKQQGLQAVFLDYLHLLDQELDVNEVRRLGALANGFKSMCRSLKIAGFNLCQVNREAYKSSSGTGVQHLLGSGMIGMASDYVMTIDGVNNNSSSDPRIPASFNLVKGRNCPTGIVPVTYFREITRFINPA